MNIHFGENPRSQEHILYYEIWTLHKDSMKAKLSR